MIYKENSYKKINLLKSFKIKKLKMTQKIQKMNNFNKKVKLML